MKTTYVYVIKNIVTNKFATPHGGWTKNPFKACEYDLSWVKSVQKWIAKDGYVQYMGKNDRFVKIAVKMVEQSIIEI